MTGTQVFLLAVFVLPLIFVIVNAISERKKKKEM